jgi:hypothetical protein
MVTMLLPGQAEPVEWTEDTTPEAVRRLARRLQRLAPGEVRCCYEAGPTGYALQRQLRVAGAGCGRDGLNPGPGSRPSACLTDPSSWARISA